jgi:hypothetical protein
MKNFIGNFIKSERSVRFEEKDVMTALKALDEVKRESRFHRDMSMEIEHRTTKDGANLGWCITFNATDNQWCKFIDKMMTKGHKIFVDAHDEYYAEE